jgi:hypothetical protein
LRALRSGGWRRCSVLSASSARRRWAKACKGRQFPYILPTL